MQWVVKENGDLREDGGAELSFQDSFRGLRTSIVPINRQDTP